MEYDQGQQDPTGSLADDFTDIYFELKRGLKLLEGGGTGNALALWKGSFLVHWGQHLVDAERQVYSLFSRRQQQGYSMQCAGGVN
ncbi:hypothetical protein CCP3SC15_4690002 [Gammaproteobacteria bacterium]